jgi:hypothetical protein
MPRHSSQILALARKGAEQRYRELKKELASIEKAFPHLCGGAEPPNNGLKRYGGSEKGKPEGTNRKRTSQPKPTRMSDTARKAASDRMRAFWAEKRIGVDTAHDNSQSRRPEARLEATS